MSILEQLKFITRLLVIGMLIFSLMRVILLLANWPYFSVLSLTDMGFGFLHGLRFDLSTLVFLFLIPICLTLFHHRIFYQISAWMVFILLVGATLFLCMDILFFQHVNRHIGTELIQIKNDLNYLWSMLLAYWHLSLLFLTTTILSAYFWHKYITSSIQVNGKFWHKLAFSPLLFLLIIIIGRGGLTVKPLTIISAFTNDSSERANLTLNGVYTGITISIDSNIEKYPYQFFSDEAIKVKTGLAKHYPFERKLTGHKNRPNIFVLQIESLNYSFIDALGGKNYQVTPFLDSLIAKSKVFKNFYAAGERSIIGLQAIWLGIPALPSLPTTDSGLMSTKLSKIGQIARQQGYRNIFVQSSLRESFHIDSLAKSIGFDEFYGMEDIGSLLLDYPENRAPDFGYDYESLQLFKDRIFAHFAQNSSKNPVLGSFFSGTSHSPFIKMPKPYNQYPHHIHGLNGMLNSIAYLDGALKNFFTEIEQQPWFENSVFLITADHAIPRLIESKDYTENYHIPLIVYSPKPEIIAGLKTEQFRSQLDILPTLVHLIGSDKTFSAFGYSLFKDSPYPHIANSGYTVNSIAKNGFITSNLEKTLKTNLPKSEAAVLHKRLLMYSQRIVQAIRNNKWAH